VAQEHTFSPSVCRAQAARFSADRFRAELVALIDREMESNRRSRDPDGVSLYETRSSA
jgi:hypothetical protein